MGTLRIKLLGQVSIVHAGVPLGAFPTVKERSLLGYLVINRHRAHARAVLAGRLWGDSPEPQARQSLRTSLWRLRSLVEPHAQGDARHLAIERDTVSFNIGSAYWLDVEELERAADALATDRLGHAHSDDLGPRLERQLADAAALYDGDLLEGCYEDWCIVERERLQCLFVEILSALVAHHRAQGSYAPAIRYARRLLSFDPLLEETHREVMRLYWLAGNRAAALRQYERCKELLGRELDVEPMEETRDLYHRISHANAPEHASLTPEREPALPPGLMSHAAGEHLRDVQLSMRRERLLSELRGIRARFRSAGLFAERSIAALEAAERVLATTDAP